MKKQRSSAKLVAAQPTPQQLVNYANALNVVNNYSYAITNQQLPVLNYPPTNYADFAAQFGPAKQHALNWSTNIFPSIVQFPSTLVGQAASLFSMEETFVTAYLNELIADPSNTTAQAGLKSALSTLQQIISQQTSAVQGMQSQLTSFGTDIQGDASTLTTIANEALSDAGTDQQSIDTLTANIQQLQNEISTYQTVLTISEIGIPVSIFTTLIGAVVCVIPGGQGAGIGIIVTGVAGLAVSITGTVLASLEIQALQNTIQTDQTQISGLNQDIVQLQGVSAQFTQLEQANVNAQNALTDIEAMWNALNTVVGDVSSELTDVDNEATSADYAQALSDFQDAEKAWDVLVAFAQALANINYSWQDSDGNWHTYGTQNPAANNGSVGMIPSNSSVAA